MVGGVQDRKGKRLFIEGGAEEGTEKNHTLTCILCSLAKGKSFFEVWMFGRSFAVEVWLSYELQE